MADDSVLSVLSHPEILAHEKLVDMLSTRGIPKEELLLKGKDILVQLFYRFIVPLPQRPTNMRRSNRLNKTLNPVKVEPVKSSDLERKESNPGLKRKQHFLEMDRTMKVAKVSHFFHEPNLHSPTSDCAKQIIELTMNCAPKTAAKPVKLSRKCLSAKQQTINNYSNPLKINTQRKDISRTDVSQNKSPEESINRESNVDRDEEKHKTFERNTVTWP